MKTRLKGVGMELEITDRLEQGEETDNPIDIVKPWQVAISGGTEPPNRYRRMTPQRQNLHLRLMLEEVKEMFDAIAYDDVENIMKESADVLVIWSCAVMELGLGDVIIDVLRKVQESNMLKTIDGRVMYREDGKVMKGKNYRAPSMTEFSEIVNPWVEEP